MTERIKVGIVGGTGYTGSELIRLLSAHPKVQITVLTSRGEAGVRVDAFFPALRGISELVFVEPSFATLCACDVVFFATPHGVCMQMAPDLLAAGVKVIDLGADFRLQDLQVFSEHYGLTHSCPDVLKQAVYGLCEANREAIKTASLVANPGCYPTTAILGLKPVIDKEKHSDTQLIEQKIIIDAKSGVSGAGRQAKLSLLYGQIAENFSAYGVKSHRHSPEIDQGMHQVLGARYRHKIRFVPHLVPMFRGMFSTIHLSLSAQGAALDWHDIYQKSYEHERFIDVMDKGALPDTQSVRASNTLRISVFQEETALTILVVQDNLVKGAAGQALQNLNLMFGFDEHLGLCGAPIAP